MQSDTEPIIQRMQSHHNWYFCLVIKSFNTYILIILISLLPNLLGSSAFCQNALEKAEKFDEDGQYDSARFYYRKVVDKLNGSTQKLEKIRIWRMLGETYYTQSHYDMAVKEFYEIRKLIDLKTPCKVRLRNEFDIIRMMYGLAEMDSCMSALLSMQNALTQCRDSSLWVDYYYFTGVLYFETGQMAKFKTAFQHSLDYAYPLKDYMRISMIKSIMGEMLYRHENKPLQAKPMLEEAIFMAGKANNLNAMAFAYIKLGIFYHTVHKYKEALNVLDTSYHLFDSLGSWVDMGYVKAVEGEIYRDMGMADSTYNAMFDLKKIRDTIYSKERMQAATKFRTLFQIGEREKENLALQVKSKAQKIRTTNIIFGLVISILALLIFGLYRFQRIRHNHAVQKFELQQSRMKAMMEAEEKERVRIAKELHDGLGQILSSARLHVGGLEGLDNSTEANDKMVQNALGLIDNSISEVRQISHALMPSVLMELGLIAAIRQLVTNLSSTNLIDVQFNHQTSKESFDSSTEIAIYRIIQEVINNVLKHANAKVIRIDLNESDGHLKLKISDDGKGFDANSIHSSSGIGWRNILSRIQMANGKLFVNSVENKGTEVLIDLPV